MKNPEIDNDTVGLSIRQGIEEAFKRIADRTKRRESTEGRSSGSKKIDSLCGRIQPGDLLVYAGYPRQYKTSLIMQIAAKLATEKCPVLWCSSMHTTRRQLTRRLLASSDRIPLACITAAMLSSKHWPELTRAVGRLADEVFFYFKTVSSIEQDLADIRNLIREHDIQLLVIDPLQPADQPTTITSSLKQIAVECKSIVIAVVDLPSPIHEKNKPNFRELWQMQDIEDDADSLCLLYHQTIPDPQGIKPQIECLNISNGAESCRLFFTQEHPEFTDKLRAL